MWTKEIVKCSLGVPRYAFREVCMKTATVRARIEPSLKIEVEVVLKELGLICV